MTEDDRAQAIREKFPHWDLWKSGLDRWWAFRDTMPHAQLAAGCRMTLDADELPELEVLLDEQERKIAAV